MRKVEILTVIITALTGLALCLWLDSLVYLIVMNLVLLVYYVLMLMGKLPDVAYPKAEYQNSWEYKSSILSSIGYFAFCSIAYVSSDYFQLFGRIGYLIVVIDGFVIILGTFFRRLFFNLPSDRFLQNQVTYLRCVIVFFANVFILPHMTYSSEATYVGGVLKYKLVKNGTDTHETVFVDSLSCYMTISNLTFSDSVIYVKYYSHYPDDILKIDTLPVGNYKCGVLKNRNENWR